MEACVSHTFLGASSEGRDPGSTPGLSLFSFVPSSILRVMLVAPSLVKCVSFSAYFLRFELILISLE